MIKSRFKIGIMIIYEIHLPTMNVSISRGKTEIVRFSSKILPKFERGAIVCDGAEVTVN